MTAIKVTNLRKCFLDEVAVNDISFAVPYGEITALLGSNGAGKSTTLNIIAGIMLPTSGSVEIAGLTFDNSYKKIKNKLGYLTSDMAMYESFSVYESLKILAELKNYNKAKTQNRIEELAHEFELDEIMDKHYSELSSGQKQRALISVSVLHDPEILIFDEVTASLDILVSKRIMDYLIKEKKRGKAILFSTHILSEVEYLSDRILMIEKGRLVRETNYEELMRETEADNLTEAFYEVLQEEKIAA